MHLLHCLRTESRAAQPGRSRRCSLARAPCETAQAMGAPRSSRQNQQPRPESAAQDWGGKDANARLLAGYRCLWEIPFRVFSLSPSPSSHGPARCVQRCDVHSAAAAAYLHTCTRSATGCTSSFIIKVCKEYNT